MKTILRIIIILLVAAFVAGGCSLVVNNLSIASGPTGESGQPPATLTEDGQSTHPVERPAGGEGGASITRGLSEVLVTLVKLTVITIVVLLLQKGFSLLRSLKLRPAR